MREPVSKEQLERMLDAIADTVVVLDRDGRIMLANFAAEKVFGLQRNDIIGRAYNDPSWRILTADGEPFPEEDFPFARAVGAGEPASRVHYTIERPDGTRILLSTDGMPLRDEKGKAVGVVLTLRNATECQVEVEELRRVGERFRLLTENAQDLIYRYRLVPTPGFEYVSPSATAITGYTPEEHYADPYLGVKIVHPDDRPLLEEAMKSPPKKPIELRWIRKDGTVIWTEQRNVPIYDEAGNLIAIEGIARDITGRKRVEEELEFRSLLLDGATDSVFVFDPEENMVYVNEAAYKTRGYTKEELLSMSLQKLDTPEYAKLAKSRMETLMKKGSLVFEAAHFRKDGTAMPVEVHARIIDYRGRKAILSIARDITNRKEVESALRQSEERFRTLFETMAQGVVYHDSTGKIVSANPASQKVLGLTLGQMLGRTSMDPRWRAIHEDGSEFPGETHPAMVALRTGKEVLNVIMGVFDSQEERYRWININAVPQFRPGETTPYQVYATFDDISERKRAKELSDALSDINAAINSTLDFDEIMQRVVVESAKAIGSETAAIDLREDGFWVVRYLYGLPKESIGTRFTDEESRHSVIAAREKRPFVSNDALRDERLNRDIVERFDISSMLVVPLVVREEVIGIILFINHREKAAFDEVQVDFAEKLAASVSLALENAGLYEAQRHIADTLQESLLVMPEKIEGVEYGYLYRSATEEAKVGGDFYDIFELEHGKIGIVIGDVAGSGIEANSLTIVVKNTIKANAYGYGTPALIMAKTNDLVRRVTPPGNFVTCFFGVLDTETGELFYCSAGHPPAVIKRGTGGVDLLTRYSPVIGAFSGLHYRTGKEKLGRDDVLIAYTDGVTEARCDRDFFGQARLVEVIKGLQSIPARDAPRVIFNEVIRCAGGKLSDDVAILTVSLKGNEVL